MMSASWAPMMAAMMLPGALPAISRSERAPLFAGSYLIVWTLAGLAVYAFYMPPAPAVAAILVAAAVVYELTPWARACRRRCRAERRSGLRFGAWCVGSSIGLMALFVALGPMSVVWMSVIASVVLAQKVLPRRDSK